MENNKMIIAGKLRKTGVFDLPLILNDYYINSKKEKSNGKVFICDVKLCDNDFINMIKEHIDVNIIKEN